MRLSLIALVQFLIGRKQAIQGIAHNPKALLVGFIFCKSADLGP